MCIRDRHHPLYLEFRGKKSDHFLDIANKIYKKVDYFIVTSSDTKKLLSKKFNINSNIIYIVEPGIEKLKKYKKPPSKFVKLLTCGSIIERKKYDYLINEIQKIDNIELNIIGDTSRETKYSAKIKKPLRNLKGFIYNIMLLVVPHVVFPHSNLSFYFFSLS